MDRRNLISGLFGLALASAAIFSAPAQALVPIAPLAAQTTPLTQVPAAAVATDADVASAKIDNVYYYYRRHYRPRYHYYRRHYRRHYYYRY